MRAVWSHYLYVHRQKNKAFKEKNSIPTADHAQGSIMLCCLICSSWLLQQHDDPNIHIKVQRMDEKETLNSSNGAAMSPDNNLTQSEHLRANKS